MLILGIETSCDECSIAVVKDGKKILSNIILTQSIHKTYGGVVPELAGREHIKSIRNIFFQALKKANINAFDLDGIAVTNEPGLLSSLLVGNTFAKGLCLSLNIPFVNINHIHGHIYAPHLEFDLNYPYITLVLSGGHSLIVLVKNYDDIEILGSTVDDSCGEAFDKIAKYYNLGYPGGPAVDKIAKSGDPLSYNFPISKISKYNMSYSGLKNACINMPDKFQKGTKNTQNIAASFQKTAVDSAVDKFFLALDDYKMQTGTIVGGVGANSYLRKRINDNSDKYKISIPCPKLCTDNGAMIGGLGYFYIQEGKYSLIDEGVNSSKIRFKNN